MGIQVHIKIAIMAGLRNSDREMAESLTPPFKPIANNKYMVNPTYKPSGNFRSLFTRVASIPNKKAKTIGVKIAEPRDESRSIFSSNSII